MTTLEEPATPPHSAGMPSHVAAMLLLVSLAAVLLIAHRAEPFILRNASPSVPIGFYLRTSDAPTRGRFVTVSAAAVAPDYARARDFADPTDRFIKRVAAVSGDVVCGRGDIVEIGDALILTRASADSAGRALPRWEGCRTLMHDEVFLLGDTSDSFDSRYWGPVTIAAIDGVWRPLNRGSSSDSEPQ